MDRLRRRPILIIGDLGRALSLASIPIAYELRVLTIWQLYVVGFVNGCLTVFFDVAYQSYLPSLVERDEILEGNSKLEISRIVAADRRTAVAGGAHRHHHGAVRDHRRLAQLPGVGGLRFGIRRNEPPPGPTHR